MTRTCSIAISSLFAAVASVAACSSSDEGAPNEPAPSSDAGVEASPADGDGASAADWTLAIDPGATPAGKLGTGLLGQYDLSGALFRYDQVPGLAALMKPAGMLDWRMALGRWEVSTRLLPTLTDGTDCTKELGALPAAAYAPQGASDLDLIAGRDWFVDDGTPVSLDQTLDDARYDLAYDVRSWTWRPRSARARSSTSTTCPGRSRPTRRRPAPRRSSPRPARSRGRTPCRTCDHAGAKKPLYGAYALLAQVIAGGSDRLAIAGHPDGRFDDGMGAALVSRDRAGKVRALLVNRGTAARTARIDRSGAAAMPTKVTRFDDPSAAPAPVELPARGGALTLPPRSITLVEL